jgi:drug/metabolite transporter (DMT)-like permease
MSTLTASTSPERRALDTSAILLMIVLCALWGLQQVAIKRANADLAPVFQAGLRSAIAAVLVFGWTRVRGVRLGQADRTLWPGLIAGVLFAGEFVCIFLGLDLTSASRMSVFLYTAPCFTALGLHWFVPGERLRRTQWLGMALAFAGIVLAFADGFLNGSTGSLKTLGGDALGVLGGVCWAATTIVVRGTALARCSPSKALLYQLAVSAVILLAVAALSGPVALHTITPLTWASLAYQAVVIAFISYLVWFWLLTRYIASRLSVFSFLTPLFGVALGVILLGEHFSAQFVVAALLVLSGIAVVNMRTGLGKRA